MELIASDQSASCNAINFPSDNGAIQSWPTIVFTIENNKRERRDFCILNVDERLVEAEKKNKKQNKTHTPIKACTKHNPKGCATTLVEPTRSIPRTALLIYYTKKKKR